MSHGLVPALIAPQFVLDAAEAATRSAAELLAMGDELGTVSPGKWADLVLVDGDRTTSPRSSRAFALCTRAAGRCVDVGVVIRTPLGVSGPDSASR